MIDTETILSVFDSKGTLLKWLKNLDEAIQNSMLESIDVEQTGNTFKLIFTYSNGTIIESPPITIQGGESDIFICTFNTTTYDEITAALIANKMPICAAGGYLYTYVRKDTSNNYIFSCLYDDTNFMLYVNSIGWSTSTRPLQPALPPYRSHANEFLKVNSTGTGLQWGTPGGGGGGTQLYQHKLSYMGETYYLITTSDIMIYYDSVYHAYVVRGLILAIAYEDYNSGALRYCLPIDPAQHAPNEAYIDRVVFFNGTTWDTKTMSSSLTDTVTSL